LFRLLYNEMIVTREVGFPGVAAVLFEKVILDSLQETKKWYCSLRVLLLFVVILRWLQQ